MVDIWDKRSRKSDIATRCIRYFGLEVLTLRTLADRATPGHLARTQRIDFHFLVLCTEGGGSHMVDFMDHRLGPGSVVHVRPGQVHRFGDRSRIDGRLMLFTPAFAPPDAPIDPFGPALLVPSTRDLKAILRTVDEISEESVAPDLDEDSITVMRSSLMVVLARLARSRPGSTLRRDEIVRSVPPVPSGRRGLVHAAPHRRRVCPLARILPKDLGARVPQRNEAHRQGAHLGSGGVGGEAPARLHGPLSRLDREAARVHRAHQLRQVLPP